MKLFTFCCTISLSVLSVFFSPSAFAQSNLDEHAIWTMSKSPWAYYSIIDSAGRRVGNDPGTEGYVSEIPESKSWQPAMGSKEEGQEVRITLIEELLPGAYQIIVQGREDRPTGVAEIELWMGRESGGIDSTFQSVVTPGSKQKYIAEYHRDTSKAISVSKVVTSASMQRELEGMQELDWLENEIADEFIRRLTQVSGYLVKQDSTLARTRLRVLQDRLDAVQDKLGGDGAAYRILSDNLLAMLSGWSSPLSLAPLSGAVTVAAQSAGAKVAGNRLTVAGADHLTDGSPSSSGDDAHAVWAATEAAQQAILGALKKNSRDNLTGTGPDAPDVRAGALGFDAEALAASAESKAGRRLPKKLSGKRQVGTPQQPVVAYAPDGLKMSGPVRGAGVLVVDGTLDMKGRSRWQGPVIVRSGQTPPEAHLGGNAQITGGLLLLNPGGAATLNLNGNAAVRLSRAALQFADEKLR